MAMTYESKAATATIISLVGTVITAVGGFLGWKSKKDEQRAAERENRAADRENNERFLEQLDCRIDRAVDRRFNDYINNGEGA